MGKFEFGADSIIKFIEYLKQNSLIKLTNYVLVVAFWIILIVSAFNYREVFGWVYETATKIAIEDHDRLTDYRISISDDIDNMLKDICSETGGTRAYILEFHNGTNNPTGLPFNYMNMTYEYTDITRTYALGEIKPEIKEHFQSILKCVYPAIDIDKNSLDSEDKLAKHHTVWVEEFLLKNSQIVKQAVVNKKLYIAKCHLSHQTGKVHLLNSNMDEINIK